MDDGTANLTMDVYKFLSARNVRSQIQLYKCARVYLTLRLICSYFGGLYCRF